jgi:hypothetical protein
VWGRKKLPSKENQSKGDQDVYQSFVLESYACQSSARDEDNRIAESFL